jgi:hypothetical protein
MAVVTLRPSGDGTTTGWTREPASGTFAAKIVDDPDSNDADTSYVLSPNVLDGTMFVELDDVPADFDPDAINSITIKVAHRRLNTPNMAVDLGTVNAFLTRADELTAISTTPTAVSSPIQAGYALTSFTPSPTGTHTVAEWNGARLALVFDHTNNQTADSVNQIRITAAEVTIDYTPADTSITGTGALSGQAATVDGAGESSSTGTGTVTAQASAIDGAGVSGSTGTGALSAQAADVTGEGTVGTPAITGTGTLAAAAADVEGAGVSLSAGSGALDVDAASVDGAGASTSIGTGTLAAQASAVDGAGVSESTGMGELVAQAAQVSGSEAETITGTGELVAGAASVEGIGAVSDGAPAYPGAGTNLLLAAMLSMPKHEPKKLKKGKKRFPRKDEEEDIWPSLRLQVAKAALEAEVLACGAALARDEIAKVEHAARELRARRKRNAAAAFLCS